jgi:GMP synthase-like glutamine amidotransferase
MRVLTIVHQSDAGAGVFGRVLRERGCDAFEWIPSERPPPAAERFDAALVFGGSMNVDEEDEHPWLRSEKALLRALLARGTPTLGVCLGAQLLAEVAGGGARRAREPELGWTAVELLPAASADPLLGALPPRFASLEWHRYELSPPPDATVLARSAAYVQAFRLDAAPWWGIQFHAEVTRATAERWVREHSGGEPLDRGAVLARTRDSIEGWNALGAGLCGRFLELDARVTAPRRRGGGGRACGARRSSPS